MDFEFVGVENEDSDTNTAELGFDLMNGSYNGSNNHSELTCSGKLVTNLINSSD